MNGRDTTLLTVLPDESAVLVEARSSVGRISFGTTSVAGQFRGVLVGDEIDVMEPVEASLVVPVASLTSGNQLYDAEIRSRLNARRYPTITAELRTAEVLGTGRYAVTGNLMIRGTTRRHTGTIEISVTNKTPLPEEQSGVSPGGVMAVASGSLIVDIRDFDIELPSVLMLHIYPDVTVSFRVTAVSDDYRWRTDN